MEAAKVRAVWQGAELHLSWAGERKVQHKAAQTAFAYGESISEAHCSKRGQTLPPSDC